VRTGAFPTDAESYHLPAGVSLDGIEHLFDRSG
jgi:hypothetical protein